MLQLDTITPNRTVGRKPRMAMCHPDREAFDCRGGPDKDLCLQCYTEKRGTTPRLATECGHPERMYYGNGCCRPCTVRRWVTAHPESNTADGWNKRHPEKFQRNKRTANLKKVGCTIEQYDLMWEAQSGKCANLHCNFTAPKLVPDFRHALVVDHDHDTGEIRGLLCRPCNTALGHVGDSYRQLIGLVEYLRVRGYAETGG